MKIHNLAQIAIACLALLSPRLIASGGIFGGAVGPEILEVCNRGHLDHECSGPTTCGSIPTTQTTTNKALILYLVGDIVVNCSSEYPGMGCTGAAREPDQACDHKFVEEEIP